MRNVWLAIGLVLLGGCVFERVGLVGEAGEVGETGVVTAKEAYAVVVGRVEIREMIDRFEGRAGEDIYLLFEEGRYVKEEIAAIAGLGGAAWEIRLFEDHPTHRLLVMTVYVLQKDGRVFVDRGLEDATLLEDWNLGVNGESVKSKEKMGGGSKE